MYAVGYMTVLLLPASVLLLSSVNSSVYVIKPANQDTNITANTLDYYLQNATKYFASNIHLCFLPGIYQLDMIIKIQNVHNFSLNGSNTTINCLSSMQVLQLSTAVTLM